MKVLKQSTQVVKLIGPFLDKADGVTEETGLAGVGTEISKEGAAFGAGPVLGTHDSDGWYPITLTTTHTNTLGELVIKVHDAATHLPVWERFTVVVANVYDSLYGAGTDKLDVNVEEWNTTAVPAEHTAGYPIVTIKDGTGTGEINTNGGKVVGVETVDSVTDLADGAINAASLASDTITAAKVHADVSQEIADTILSRDASSHTTNSTLGAIVNDWEDAGRLDAILDARASQTSVDAVDDFVDTEVALILTRIGTPSDLGGGASLAANLADIEAQTDDIGSAGAGLTALATAAELAKVPKSDSNVTWNATALASIQTEANDALVANNLDHLVLLPVATSFHATVDPDSVIGYLANDGLGADTGTGSGFDRAFHSLEALGDSGGGGPTAAEIADAVWDEATAGHTTGGTFGEQVKTDVDAILADTNELQTDWTNGGRLDLLLDATLADTNELQTDWANGGRLDNILDARASQTSVDDLPTNAELATALGTADDAVLAAIAALNNLSAAQVNAEVDTALADVGLTTTITGRIDAAVSTRLASASYTAPDNSSITAIKAKTDSLTFTVAANLNVNVRYVNDVQVGGTGAPGDEWGPA